MAERTREKSRKFDNKLRPRRVVMVAYPDAQIVVGFLKSQGIDAMISEDDAGDQLPSLEAALGVKIFVPEDDAERARKLIAERQ